MMILQLTLPLTLLLPLGLPQSSQSQDSPNQEATEAAWNTAWEQLQADEPAAVLAALHDMRELSMASPGLEDDFLVLSLRIECGPRAELAHTATELRGLLGRQAKGLGHLADWLETRESQLDPHSASAFWRDLADKGERLLLSERELSGTVSGSWRSSLGLVREIEAYHRSAIKADGASAAAVVGLARWKFAESSCELKEVTELLERAFELEPGHPQGLLVRACIQLCGGHEFLARKDISAAVASKAYLPAEAISEVARLMLDRGHPQQVIELLGRAARATDDPEIWFHYASGSLAQSRKVAIRGTIYSSVQHGVGSGAIQLGPEDAAELRAAFDRAAEGAPLYQRTSCLAGSASLSVHLGDAPGALNSLRLLVGDEGASAAQWFEAQKILDGVNGLDSDRKLDLLQALVQLELEGTPTAHSWAPHAILGQACARRGELERAAEHFAEALQGTARRAEEQEIVGAMLRLVNDGTEAGKDVASKLLAKIERTASPAAREALRNGQARREAEAVLGGMLEPTGALGAARASSINEDIYWELTEYVNQLSHSPLSYGGVPMVRYVDEDLNIRSHVVGDPYILNW